jgi:hypothetical protein
MELIIRSGVDIGVYNLGGCAATCQLISSLLFYSAICQWIASLRLELYRFGLGLTSCCRVLLFIMAKILTCLW